MTFEYSQFQKYAIRWLTVFSMLCGANSVLVIVFGIWNFDGYFLAFILPFAHLFVVVVFYMVFGFYQLLTGRWIGDDEQYIKSNHPIIWKKLHPWGDNSRNDFTTIRFIKSRYDDGTDERLNQIKFRYKVNSNLMCWPFLLTLVIWISNLLLIAMLGWHWPEWINLFCNHSQ